MIPKGALVGGKYRLLNKLGSGGMGTVYEALNIHLAKTVAIKILKPELSDDENATARFRQEARASAAIGHPNIVDVYDIVFDSDGIGVGMLIIMERLDGQSLAQLLEQRGKLDVGLAAYVTCQLLSALDAAHDGGIVHRDIKPENLYLVETGQIMPAVRLLDFGISKLVADGGPVDRLTTSGVVLGTPYFMSPEQASGETDLDHRVDLWAAGVLLYECIIGELPFDGPNYNAVLAAILTQPAIPPSMKEVSLPAELDTIVLRALEHDRDRRYPDATTMLEALLPLVPERARELIPGVSGEFSATIDFSPADSTEPVEEQSAATAQESRRPSEAPTLEPTTRRSQPRRTWLLAAVVLVFTAVGAVVAASMFATDRTVIDDGTVSETSSIVAPGNRENTDAVTTDGGIQSAMVIGRADAASPQSGSVGDGALTTVTITLDGVHENAAIFLDDTRVAGDVVEIPRSRQSRQLKIVAGGYKTWLRQITPLQDSIIEVAMEAERNDRPRPKSHRWRQKNNGSDRSGKQTSGADPRLRKNPFDH